VEGIGGAGPTFIVIVPCPGTELFNLLTPVDSADPLCTACRRRMTQCRQIWRWSLTHGRTPKMTHFFVWTEWMVHCGQAPTLIALGVGSSRADCHSQGQHQFRCILHGAVCELPIQVGKKPRRLQTRAVYDARIRSFLAEGGEERAA